MSKVTYLDNNATTRVAEEVLEAMLPFFCDYYGNASSVYEFGAQVHDRLEHARKQVAELLGAEHPHEIIFTSCGSESDNTAIHSAVRALPNRKRIVTSAVEHLAVLDTCRAYKKEGYEVIEVGVDEQGQLDMDAYKAAVNEQTCLVSLMYANNESGVVFPIEEASALAKGKGAIFHTDAVQAAGKIPLNMGACPHIDMLSISGHKFHAPKGIGALYVRNGTPFDKFMLGGHQERNRRAGTEASALIVGLGAAAELAASRLEDEETRVKGMRDRLQKELVAAIPDIRVNAANAPRTPNTLSVAFKYADEEIILRELSAQGICASSGSACNSEVIEPSHVMKAMGVPPEYLNGVLRISLSHYTDSSDIDAIVSALPGIVRLAQSQSLFNEEL